MIKFKNETKLLKIEEEIHKSMYANLDEAINKMTEKTKENSKDKKGSKLYF